MFRKIKVQNLEYLVLILVKSVYWNSQAWKRTRFFINKLLLCSKSNLEDLWFSSTKIHSDYDFFFNSSNQHFNPQEGSVLFSAYIFLSIFLPDVQHHTELFFNALFSFNNLTISQSEFFIELNFYHFTILHAILHCLA